MALNIKNEAVEEKIRELAKIDGTSLTGAIDRAVEESLRTRKANDPAYCRDVEAFLDQLRQLQPLPAGVTSDHSDLYDDDGMPT